MQAAARNLTVLSFACMASYLPATAQAGGAYKVTNLVSDGSVPAITTDANFINPWAVSSSPSWWISAQGTGFNYVVQAPGTIRFKVIVPAASGQPTATGLPTGSVTTAGASGMILPNGAKAAFLFSTLDGTISGWNSQLGNDNAITQIAINNSAAGASYRGLAIINTTTANNATASYILAPNFGTGNAIEVYDSTFKPTKLAGSFTDPNLPANYAPFSVHILGTHVFVTYALRTTTTPYSTVNAPGNGIVSVFDTSGNFVARAVTGGNLNAPWGVAFAPASFGVFSNDLLIGDFGNGMINVYDPNTYAYLGQLIDATGNPLVYPSLWELLTGGTAVGNTTTVSGGDLSTVYFTAGLANEAHGLFAGIAIDTSTSDTPTFGFSASTAALTASAGTPAQATISVVPTNNFTGTVTLACSGLPTSSTCSFSPSQLTVSPTAAATSTLSIETNSASAGLQSRHLRDTSAAGITSVLLLPFASILIFRRRSTSIGTHPRRLCGVLLFLIALAGFVAGCGGTSPATTPVGQSNVTVTTTSGTITQQTTIALTVQ
ncbi:TIGR03118 family protein [Edaphobacter aggregans]|uniref:TIGR03118 family protein n=1 Tax=Edaphobacter aggregans TaxID=570835 RepID=UPI00068EC836|nr:TIGR03118 family protein [Edaphobacter aggregans]